MGAVVDWVPAGKATGYSRQCGRFNVARAVVIHDRAYRLNFNCGRARVGNGIFDWLRRVTRVQALDLATNNVDLHGWNVVGDCFVPIRPGIGRIVGSAVGRNDVEDSVTQRCRRRAGREVIVVAVGV